ncbi:hypothetical protein D3C86_1368090 [compost metagenome]
MASIPQSVSSHSKPERSGFTTIKNTGSFSGTRGINYNRAQDWTKNYQTVTMLDILSDFKEMKRIGINTIKRYGPDIYDRNILKAAGKNSIRIHYGYWIPDDLDFFADKKGPGLLRAKILKSVHSLKDEQNIVAWNLGNAVFQKLELYYYKPELLYQQDAYLNWLKDLVLNIKKIDPGRPLTIDVELDAQMGSTVERLRQLIPQIDAYGIVADEKVTSFKAVGSLDVPYFYSDVEVTAYSPLKDARAGIFITSWQDEKKIDQVRVNGIKDYLGREKTAFSALFHHWNNGPMPLPSPKVKVLKPALATLPGTWLNYHVLIKTGNKWDLAADGQGGLKFEWNLARVDRFEKPVTMEHLGEGTRIAIQIPEHQSDYRLYLCVIKGDKVLEMIKSELNTPL